MSNKSDEEHLLTIPTLQVVPHIILNYPDVIQSKVSVFVSNQGMLRVSLVHR